MLQCAGADRVTAGDLSMELNQSISRGQRGAVRFEHSGGNSELSTAVAGAGSYPQPPGDHGGGGSRVLSMLSAMSSIMNRVRELGQPTGEEELMDISYPEPRFRVSLKQAFILAGVLTVLLLGWWLIREPAPPAEAEDIATGEVFPALAAEGDPGVGGTTTGVGGATTSAGPTEVVVSVAGAVENPGLLTLAPEARVADALNQARPEPDAELLAVNLAQKLNDGEQIIIPRIGEAPPPPPAAPGTDTEPGPVPLNTATATDLVSLNGVGEKTAAAIIEHRESIGGFSSVEQLQEVKGIGPAKFADLVDRVVL